MDAIAILDFGSQTAQLIARRVREAHVYCELFDWDSPAGRVLALDPKGFILSGGPSSVYAEGAPRLPAYVLESGRPVLGICYGMQLMAHALDGRVDPSGRREFGQAEIEVTAGNPLLPDGRHPVWMSHGDRIERLPSGFQTFAHSESSPIAGMADPARGYYGVQFHPEVRHTPGGKALLEAFVTRVCAACPGWTPAAIIEQSVAAVQAQVGGRRALAAVSGGVDSLVATALVQRAIGERLTAVFVDTGLLRTGEAAAVVQTFGDQIGVPLRAVQAVEDFLEALNGVVDPEEKRRRIGERFIRIFEEQARLAGSPPFLVQGTIYPDVVESSAPDRRQAERIKTHHNVGGLPEKMDFQLVEPLRFLFKDEVRTVGEALGLPPGLVWRQPFPGPGLAVRCLGEVTSERLARLRSADKIVTDELQAAGLLGQMQAPSPDMPAQAFAVLLPVRTVGVMGDQRTYQEVVAIRAVSTDDFMTADWTSLPDALLRRIATRIVNEVAGVNRVVYDITSKPPATIEWE